MALTRNFLKGLSLNDEQISAVIEAHAETVDALKGKLDAANKDLEAVKASGWEEKYIQLGKEFEGFKADVAAKDKRAAQERAYTELLKDAGISDKRIATILKYDTDRITALELDEKGTLKGAKELSKAVAADWADFIAKPATQGAQVQNPPATGNAAGITAEQFAKMGYKQRLDLYNTDPETYNALSGKT